MSILDAISHFFQTQGFMPHGMCLLWRPSILWSMVIGNTAIALAYFIIPIELIYLIVKRKDITFKWIFVLFGAFILACGFTHVMAVLTLWIPTYGLEALVLAFTGVVSMLTAILLWPLLPTLLKIPSPWMLEKINNQLKQSNDIILNQQKIIRKLSTPVFQLRSELLILPIIGEIDSERAQQITEQLLHSIRKKRAKIVIIDISSVPIVDSQVANHLICTIDAAKLMGATIIISGISAEIASTLVTMSVDLSKIKTVGDLEAGIETAERMIANKTALSRHEPTVHQL